MPSKTPSLKAGSALIFDYRLKHRGLGNSGTEERPLLYITYAKPFWLDVYNFDRKRYKNLPAVAKQARRRAESMRARGGARARARARGVRIAARRPDATCVYVPRPAAPSGPKSGSGRFSAGFPRPPPHAPRGF